MTLEKTYSLNSILEEIYKKKRDIDQLMQDDPQYKEFKNERIRDLKKICSSLGVNLDEFKKNNRYSIPEFIKDIIEEYLSVSGIKGGFISKLRTEKIEEITIQEKLEFTQGLKKRVEANKEYDEENRSNIIKLLEWNLHDLQFLVIMKASQESLLSYTFETIEKDLSILKNKNTRDGLIRFKDVKNGVDLQRKDQLTNTPKNIRQLLKNSLGNRDVNRALLDSSDIDALINVYEELINQASRKWNQIVNDFEEVKNEKLDALLKSEIKSEDILDIVLEDIDGFEKQNKEDVVFDYEDIESFLTKRDK